MPPPARRAAARAPAPCQSPRPRMHATATGAEEAERLPLGGRPELRSNRPRCGCLCTARHHAHPVPAHADSTAEQTPGQRHGEERVERLGDAARGREAWPSTLERAHRPRGRVCSWAAGRAHVRALAGGRFERGGKRTAVSRTQQQHVEDVVRGELARLRVLRNRRSGGVADRLAVAAAQRTVRPGSPAPQRALVPGDAAAPHPRRRSGAGALGMRCKRAGQRRWASGAAALAARPRPRACKVSAPAPPRQILLRANY